jgi:hypothetical protein
MSLYQKASLVQIPSGYKAADAKLYSVVPNSGDGDFTVSSDADATRVNKDGLIETTVANQARLNYDPTNPQDPHLLLEPTRQNIIQYSELFDNSYWTKEGVTIGTGIVSPMGDTDAQNIIEDTTTGRHRVRATLAVSSGTTYSLSVWAKSTNRNLVINADVLFNARSGFNLSTGSIENTTSGTATITAFPNDWFLCTVKGTATSTQATVSYLQMQTGTTDANYTGDGSSTLSLFGAQLEAGSYPTSYIPTVESAVTRTVDTAKIEPYSALPSDYPLTVFWEGKIDNYNAGQFIFSIFGTGSAAQYLGFAWQSSSYFYLYRRSSTANDADLVSFSSNQDTNYKVAVSFISNTQAKVYINGSEVYDLTSGLDVDYEFNSVLIGSQRIAADNGFRNSAKQFMVFNEALTNAELQTLTS